MSFFSIISDILTEISSSLTALEVAKSEYLDVFGIGDKRPSSALSNHTIRPVDSFASLASVYLGSQTDSSSLYSTDHFDINSTIHQLLTSLRVTSPTTYHRKHSFEHINYLESNLEKTTHQCDQIIQHFRDRINEATKVVNDLQRSADKIDAMRDVVAVASQGKLFLRSISPKKRHRDSEDSQLTVFSHDNIVSSRPDHTTPGNTSTATQTGMSDYFPTHSTSSFNPTWFDRFIQSPNSTSYKSYLNELREVSELQKKDHGTTTSPTKIAIKFKQLAKKKKRLEEKIYDLHQLEGKHSFSSTSRVKAWLKRMVTPVKPPHRLEIVFDIDERNCFVGREVKRLQGSPTICGDAIDASIDNALRNSQVVLEAVKRDLESIKKSFVAVNFYFSFFLTEVIFILLFFKAEQFINMANHSVSRAHRAIKGAIKVSFCHIDPSEVIIYYLLE